MPLLHALAPLFTFFKMRDMVVPNWHVYAGSEVGILKGIDTEKQTFSNLNSLSGLDKDEEITSMCWENSSEKKIYTGHRNQFVKTFDCDTQSFSAFRNCQIGTGSIKGLCQYDGNIVTAVKSGIVKMWKKNDEGVEINTGENLCAMVPNPFTNFQVATGGKENDLKIWDLQNSVSPVFSAKNVKNDFLDLRVPVWITDMKFRTNDKIITCTRHHQIRLYDVKAQRRPVIDMEFERFPLMCLSLAHNEHQIVVGSSRGRMALIDLRKKLLVHVFKGFNGSIRSVQCHPTMPLVASCGLDRFLRIHDLNKHKLLKKVYLKTRLNCLLFKRFVPATSYLDVDEVVPLKNIPEVEDEQDDNLWSSMQIVKDKRKLIGNAEVKIKKKRTVEQDNDV